MPLVMAQYAGTRVAGIIDDIMDSNALR
jgi:hypothetical protein